MIKPPLLTPRRRRLLAIIALIAGMLLMTLFGVRSWKQYDFAQRVERGEIKVESLRGWMTLPYIAQVYGVPQSQLRAALNLPATGNDERNLRDWLDQSGIDPVAGRARIEALILAETARREAK